jgi:hypothetical protein
LVLPLLAATFFFHYQHLKAATHPVHVVLGELYETTQSYADKLAESLQGADYPSSTFRDRVDADVPVSVNVDAAMYLNTLIQLTQQSACSDPALANLVQEIEGALCQKRYLLQLALRS